MRSLYRLPRLTAATALVLSVACLVRGEDFRVDSKVFIGKEDTPHSTNITMFQGPHVYDFLDTPRQITFYDLERGRVVLLNPARRAKVEVSRTMLDAFCDNLRHLESRMQDPVLDFALRPTFDERDEKDGGERVFASKYITYRVKPLAGELAGMAGRYRAFSDASARLNALVNRGSLPPFPRLAVNQSLEKSGHVPGKVHVKISSARWVGGKTVTMASEHEFRPRLLASDLRQIDEAGDLLAGARLVGLTEYLRPSGE